MAQETCKIKDKPAKKTRRKLKCPIKDCLSQQRKPDGFQKLSQHIKQYHHINDKAEREQLCAIAKQSKVFKTSNSPPAAMKTHCLINQVEDSSTSDEETEDIQPIRRKTRSKVLDDSSDSSDEYSQLDSTPLIEQFKFLDRSRDSKTSTIFDNKTFTSYLMAAEAKDKDVATRISDDATKFFNNVTHSSTSSYVDVILNTSCLMEYINMLQQQNLSPSTIIDKLRNLRLVIDYIGCKENATMTDKELGCKCEVVQKWLQKRSKALRKDICMQKFANAIKGEQDVQNADDPTKFIIDADVQNEIFRILAKSETEVISKNEHNTVIAYLAATIIYKNSQRPGVIENMSIEEFECRKMERKNRILIRVLRHKTASSTGPANITINKHCEDVMSQYYNSIRLKISAQNKELTSHFFLTNMGPPSERFLS